MGGGEEKEENGGGGEEGGRGGGIQIILSKLSTAYQTTNIEGSTKCPVGRAPLFGWTGPIDYAIY